MLFCLIFAVASYTWRGIKRDTEGCGELLKFPQLIDHSSTEGDTFDQQYYYVNTSEVVVDGSVVNAIVDIGGESDSFSPAGCADFVKVLAEDLKAPVFTIEHRYFGGSYPTVASEESYSKYMNVDQVLKDLEGFVDYLRNSDPKYEKTKFLVTGGSYSGLLSSFARSFSSDHFHAALSSSGVVLATDNYTDFDLQIGVSLGQECAAAARKARIELVDMLQDPANDDWITGHFDINVDAWYEGKGEEDQRTWKDDFYFVIGELFTIAPQYGYRAKLCDPLVDAVKSNGDIVAALATFSKDFFVPKFCDGDMAKTYSSYVMRAGQDKSEGVAARSWMWMCCNEVAYWQVSPGRLSIRPHQLDQTYFQDQCDFIFPDRAGTAPAVAEFNEKYKGLNQPGTRIFFSTASQDPWTWTCVTEEYADKNLDQVAHTVAGLEIGHCSDLHAPKDSDPPDLKRTREYERALFKRWMAEDDQ